VLETWVDGRRVYHRAARWTSA